MNGLLITLKLDHKLRLAFELATIVPPNRYRTMLMSTMPMKKLEHHIAAVAVPMTVIMAAIALVVGPMRATVIVTVQVIVSETELAIVVAVAAADCVDVPVPFEPTNTRFIYFFLFK